MKKKHLSSTLSTLLASAVLALGCGGPADQAGDPEDGRFPLGKADGGIDEGSPEALAVLRLVNDPSVTLEELDVAAALNKRAARNIINYRNGADETAGTEDDETYDTLRELDDVSFVGKAALRALLDYAVEKGFLVESDASARVVFSPQILEDSHVAVIAGMIDDAEESIDIAMYSFSNAAISDALERAVLRGVKVRFIFETARAKDRKLEGEDLINSKSGRLEGDGIDVRWVNKIMHHKFLIVDGPRDDLEKAETASIASGSANWSFGGATIYDENTVFIDNAPEMALKLQKEFNLMWDHSRELAIDPDLAEERSTLEITEDMIPDNPDLDVFFTSDNFRVSSTGTTFSTRSREHMRISDVWVKAIEDATDSIIIASGHMRLKPVAEALIAKKRANPDMEILVYLDQQEYVSAFADNLQIEKREDCIESATSENKIFDCENKSFRWGKTLGDAGIDVRYKYYAYRWHFSYAVQMHHKFMIVDGDELYTGSYNLSINAEHGTFENTMLFKAPSFQSLIERYESNFERSFELGRQGQLESLRETIATADSIPIVFGSMALTWDEVNSLKRLIADNCEQINSTEFRRNAASHKFCPRD